MKRFIYFILLICSQPLFAQTKFNPPTLPASPSPEAFAMAKYVDFPTVDNYGAVPVSIPLYTIKEGSYSLPIELTYHTGGIKVSDEATWVGLGWNLRAGGCITRSVRGCADDYIIEYNAGKDSQGKLRTTQDIGWLNNPDKINSIAEGDINNFFYYNSYDTEPDIFYISAGGLSAKFVFGHDGTPKLLDCDKKISITWNKNDKGNIIEFYVTDDKGVVYTFGGDYREITTTTYKYKPTVTKAIPFNELTGKNYEKDINTEEYDVVKTFVTAWHLENIKTPETRTISLTYQASNITMNIPLNEYQTTGIGGNAVVANKWNSLSFLKHETKTWYIKQISFSLGTVDFSTSGREDLQNGLRLDKIQLLSSSNASIFYYNFGYHYMNSGGDFTTKRLVLDKIIKSNGGEKSEPFSFEYYSDNLPAKSSEKQDFWGYYSNKSTSLIPKIYIYADEDEDAENKYRWSPIAGVKVTETLDGSDRTVDESSIYAGNLNTITYPTGGKSMYVFEPNDFYDEKAESNIKGGGLRISEIKKYDENNNIVLDKIYNYYDNGKSTGVLINYLSFATPSNYAFGDNTSTIANYLGSSTYNSSMYNIFTIRSANNYFPLTNLDGYQVGYKKVSISEAGNGKVEYEYYPPKSYKTNASAIKSSPIDFIGGTDGFKDTNKMFLVQDGDESDWFSRTEYEEELYVAGYGKKTFYYTEYDCSECQNPDYTEDDEFSSGYEDEVIRTPLSYLYYGGEGAFSPKGYTAADYNSQIQENVKVFSEYNNYYARKIQGEWLSPKGNIYDRSFLSSVSWNTIIWGDVQQTGKNIYPYPPMSDGSDNTIYSKLHYERIYAEGNPTIPVQETEYQYEYSGTGEFVYGMVCQEHYIVSTGIKATLYDCIIEKESVGEAYFFNQMYDHYIMPKAWSKYNYRTNAPVLLKKVIKKENLVDGTINTENNITYNDFFLVKESSLSQSDGSVLKTVYKYPETNNSVGYTMYRRNMFDYPIEHIVYKDEYIVEGIRLVYECLGSTGARYMGNDIKWYSGGIIKPTSSYLLEINTPMSEEEIEDYYQLDATYKYDAVGNIVEYKKQDGIYTSFVWGHNKNYLVVKIVNASNSEINEALQPSFLLSLDNLNWETLGEQLSLRVALKRYLPNVQTTCFTYNPLIGISSSGDVNGRRMFYEYDDLGRLQYIKDNELNIVKKINYHYKGQ